MVLTYPPSGMSSVGVVVTATTGSDSASSTDFCVSAIFYSWGLWHERVKCSPQSRCWWYRNTEKDRSMSPTSTPGTHMSQVRTKMESYRIVRGWHLAGPSVGSLI